MPTAYFHHLEKIDHLPTAFVAGGAGFIGSHLCESLLSQNLKVICLDNLSTGKKENIKNLLTHPAFKFVEYDLNTDPLVGKFQPEYIFHLAGVEEYINGVDISLETLLVNSVGTKNILELAKAASAKFLLASSLSVYEGVLSGSSLEYDLGLSPKEVQKYSHHEAKRFSEALTTEYFRKFNLDARVVRIRDCYGPKMPLEEGSSISRLLKQALTGEKLTIEGDGLDILHPTYITDVIYGFQKAMFSQNTNGKIYTLVNPERITLVNLAYTIQKQIKSSLKIEFIPAPEEIRFPKKTIEIKKTQEELGWIPKVSLEEGIKKTLEFFHKPGKQDIEESEEREKIEEKDLKRTKEEAQLEKPKIKKSPLKIPQIKFSLPKLPKIQLKFASLLISLILITLTLTLPILSLGAETYLATKDLTTSQKLLEKGKFEEAVKKSQNAQKNFLIAKKTVNSLSWVFTLIKLRKESSALEESFEVGENLASSVSHIANAASILNGVKDDLSLGFAPNIQDKINEARLEMDLADDKMALVQALQSKKVLCPFKNAFCQNANNFIEKIPILRNMIAKTKNLINILPQILGSNNRKTYLILLQNNMELRGSGGFIGSYGLITFENGKVIDTKIEDIYAIDGQLKGHVDPPDEVLHFLGQPNWFLRDSNISPDFPLTAKRAIWFFEKETGVLVDTVFAIDLSFVKELLKIVGPLYLPDYKIKITAENLFAQAEKQAEMNFFPGSTQKKDFLAQLGRALIQELTSKADQELIPLFQKISLAIEEKHLQAFTTEKEIQEVLVNIGASGKLEDETCLPKESCLRSALLVSENNFGANKANYFLKRKIQRTTTIGREGEIREKITLVYQNESPTESWPAGKYKNWLKFYVPQGSKLLSLDISNEKKATVSAVLTEDVLKNLKKEEFLVVESTESGKTNWGTLVEVPTRGQKIVELTYELPQRLSFGEKRVKLEIVQQKQAGTEKDPLELTVGYPAFLNASILYPERNEGLVKPQEISYNTDLSVDRKLTVEFER